jgi:hypothetical protein
MTKLKGIILMGLLTFLSACSSGHKISNYEGAEPTMGVQEYFTGPIKAWGIVQDHTGKVTRRFDVDLYGSWDGDVGTLDEQFLYYDGEKQTRVWTIEKTGDRKFKGTAGDILGQADGESAGNAMRWAYEMDLDVGDKTSRIKFDDWMFLMNDGVLINRSYLKKFGFTVAELTLFMQKQEPENE